jgi:ABC-type lipoprotein export system ATPase subunit
MTTKNNRQNNRKLRAEELTKIFPHPAKKDTNIPLFANTSFELTSDKPQFIIGPSGSGKTTLLRIFMGIESISAGELFFNDQPIHLFSRQEKIAYLETIGYMDQFPARMLYLSLSVRDNLLYFSKLRSSRTRKEHRTQVQQLAKTFGLTSLLKEQSQHLSGGEMRRLCLACSMIFEPAILLCDEPTAQLDEKNTTKVLDCILDINKQFNTLVVIATHNHALLNSYPTYEIKDRRLEKCQ